MGDFSFGEMVVVAIIAILIYGKDLPSAARKLSSLYTKFRRQIADIKDDIQRQIPPEDFKLDSPSGGSSYGSEKPSTPTGISASHCGSYILLTWNSSVGASSYTVRRARGADESLSILCSGLPELSYSDYDVTPGTTYRYVVYASNSTGDSVDSEEASTEYPDEAAPAAPVEGTSTSPASTPAEPAAGAPAPPADQPAAAPPPPAMPAETPPANGNGHAAESAAQAAPPPAGAP